MKKVLSTVLAASLMLATVSAPAFAGDRGRYDGWNGRGHGNSHSYNGRGYDGRNYGNRHGGHGDAVAAGILGLTFGALIASSARRDRGYSDGYYYAPPPRTCIAREQHWDPYERAYVTIDRPYAC